MTRVLMRHSEASAHPTILALSPGWPSAQREAGPPRGGR